MKRIVLDTNVLVSALLNTKGVPAQIWDLVLAGHLHLYVDQRILLEYYNVLRRPEFGFALDVVNSILAFIDDNADRVIALPLPSVSIDPKDQIFVETAVAAKADYLVTGNLKHFTHLQKYHIRIASPKQLLDDLR
jgi:putative PIN family toxin of toxin-antitoxin system